MRKTIRILVSIVVLVLQMLIAPNSSLATGAEVGDTFVLRVIKKIDDVTMNYYGQDLTQYFTVYEKDGKQYPVYCIDYFLGGVTDTQTYAVQATEEYVNENSTDHNKIGVWKAIINGYPFKTFGQLKCANKFEAYAATKQAVYCMLYDDRDISLYSYEGDAGKRVYDAMVTIVNAAKTSNKVPTKTEINLTETDWKIEGLDNSFLSKKITLSCETPISSFKVFLTGNVPEGIEVTDLNNNKLTEFKNCKEFKIQVPLKNLTEENKFTVNIQGQVDAYPMYFGKGPSASVQNYVLTAGVVKNEYMGTSIQYPENKTKVIIKKNDNNGNILAGVKFNILDVNKNVIYENIETNEDGIIEITHMIPGKYYLQEIETLEGYEMNEEFIEFDIDLNEEKEITVENEKIPDEPEEPEIPDIPEEPDHPKIPDVSPKPEIPKTPEIPVIPPEIPKLPRTGY